MNYNFTLYRRFSVLAGLPCGAARRIQPASAEKQGLGCVSSGLLTLILPGSFRRPATCSAAVFWLQPPPRPRHNVLLRTVFFVRVVKKSKSLVAKCLGSSLKK